jgi:hypothetical protein
MRTRRYLLTLVLGLLVTAHAKDGVRVAFTSKIEAAKGRIRDKAATEWMPVEKLEKLTTENRAKGKQLIYCEYHGGKDAWRGFYTEKVKFAGYSYWTYHGEREMEEKVNEEMAKGMKPTFIARSGNWYSMMFVRPDQYAEARKLLDEIGIGEPKLK